MLHRITQHAPPAPGGAFCVSLPFRSTPDRRRGGRPQVGTVWPVPRPTVRSLVVGAIVAIAGAHLIAVTFAALPPNRYSRAVEPATDYLGAYFAQNWRLFAPSPVAADRSVMFQGSYTGDDGRVHRTKWIDWTRVELDLVHHRLVGGRAGYISNKAYGPLVQRYRALGTAQRQIADGTQAASPPSWSQLRSQLEAGGADPVRVGSFLLYERATTRLGTDVLEARWPDRTFTAVRYRVRSWPVVPYAVRGGSDAEQRAARPAPTDRDSGWRVPTPGTERERAAVARFDRRHR